MLRPMLLCAAALAFSCAAVLAQEPSDWLAGPQSLTRPPDDFDSWSGDATAPTAIGSLQGSGLSYFQSSSGQPSASQNVFRELWATPISFEMQEEPFSQAPPSGCPPVWQHVNYIKDCCSPHICRFDGPPDCTCCVTHDYCRYPCTDCDRGTFRICDKCGGWVTDSHYCDVLGKPEFFDDTAIRFGWWGVSSRGSEAITGQYQSLRSSPFWDVDTVRSDGVRTLDLIMTGLDNISNDARGRFYGPHLSADVSYEIFPHNYGHVPLQGTPEDTPPVAADRVVTNDLNVGQDYAIRVQQLDAKFHGKLTDNITWRLNVWGMRKSGERQANAAAHCFNIATPPATDNVCHVLSQSQRIDWLTKEIQPVLEARFKYATVEYSRTIRQLEQGDSVVTRQYTRFAPFNGPGNTLGSPWEYGTVPENLTQIDRVKISSDLTENNQVYANLYHGDTLNYDRDMHRRLQGYDIRLTNRSLENVTLTGYSSRDAQKNQFPPFLLPEEQDPTVAAQILHPINYTFTRAGIKGNWRPYGSSAANYDLSEARRTLLWSWGYEYQFIDRDYATWATDTGTFTQPGTISHLFEVGPYWRWSPTLDSYIRYKFRINDNPLVAVNPFNSAQFNTNQPLQEHRAEIGGTWTPTANFMTSLQFSAVNRWNHSQFAQFTENDYPIMCTAWYAPVERLSFTGGYGYFSNWIDQNITLGSRDTATSTTPANYAGQAHVVSFNSTYAWTTTVQLMAGYEYVHGTNGFSVGPAGADWSGMPTYSSVDSVSNRATAGVDWRRSLNSSLYFRYVLFDFNDVATGLNTGVTNMFLAGMTLIH
jgi:hypothetical protein